MPSQTKLQPADVTTPMSLLLSSCPDSDSLHSSSSSGVYGALSAATDNQSNNCLPDLQPRSTYFSPSSLTSFNLNSFIMTDKNNGLGDWPELEKSLARLAKAHINSLKPVTASTLLSWAVDIYSQIYYKDEDINDEATSNSRNGDFLQQLSSSSTDYVYSPCYTNFLKPSLPIIENRTSCALDIDHHGHGFQDDDPRNPFIHSENLLLRRSRCIRENQFDLLDIEMSAFDPYENTNKDCCYTFDKDALDSTQAVICPKEKQELLLKEIGILSLDLFEEQKTHLLSSVVRKSQAAEMFENNTCWRNNSDYQVYSTNFSNGTNSTQLSSMLDSYDSDDDKTVSDNSQIDSKDGTDPSINQICFDFSTKRKTLDSNSAASLHNVQTLNHSPKSLIGNPKTLQPATTLFHRCSKNCRNYVGDKFPLDEVTLDHHPALCRAVPTNLNLGRNGVVFKCPTFSIEIIRQFAIMNKVDLTPEET